MLKLCLAEAKLHVLTLWQICAETMLTVAVVKLCRLCGELLHSVYRNYADTQGGEFAHMLIAHLIIYSKSLILMSDCEQFAQKLAICSFALVS